MKNARNTAGNFLKDFSLKIQAEQLISSAHLLGLFIAIEEDGLISNILFNDNVYNLDFSHICGKNIRDFYILPGNKTIADLSFPIAEQGDKIIQKWIFSVAHTYASKNIFEKFFLKLVTKSFLSISASRSSLILALSNFETIFKSLLFNSSWLRALSRQERFGFIPFSKYHIRSK